MENVVILRVPNPDISVDLRVRREVAKIICSVQFRVPDEVHELSYAEANKTVELSRESQQQEEFSGKKSSLRRSCSPLERDSLPPSQCGM